MTEYYCLKCKQIIEFALKVPKRILDEDSHINKDGTDRCRGELFEVVPTENVPPQDKL